MTKTLWYGMVALNLASAAAQGYWVLRGSYPLAFFNAVVLVFNLWVVQVLWRVKQ
jgi:hypothetical protein